MSVSKHVDWCSGKEDFERIVEALVQRLWSTKYDSEAFAIDGRGGDGGLDIFVERDGVVVSIYQLKFFPEGMSGGFRKTRRDQVKRSFSSVCDTPGLEEWVLVLPRNPTNSELRFVRALGKNSDFQIRVWARAELDQRIAEFPDLLAWATRNPLVETLREAGMKSAALAGPNDLQDRVSALHASANSRSAFWGTNFSVVDGVLTQSLVAKRPDAPEKEPIRLGFTASFGPQHGDLRNTFEDLIDFGGAQTVRLPPEVVGIVKTEGPEWIADEAAGYAIEFTPISIRQPAASELRVVSASGALLASLGGQAHSITVGRRGFTIKASYPALEVLLKHSTDSATAANVTWKTVGQTATESLAAARLQSLILERHEVQLHIDGQPMLRLTAGSLKEPEGTGLDHATYELVEDLAFLEREHGISFTIPEDLGALDMIDIRVARMLAEGRATTWPRIGVLTASLSEEATEETITQMISPRAIYVRLEDAVMPILERPLSMGTLGAYHQSMAIRDPEHLIEAVRRGDADGQEVVFKPTDNTPIRIWREDRWGDPNKPIVPEPWRIEGILESKGLSTILAKAEEEFGT